MANKKINKIRNIFQLPVEPPQIEVIVKKDGEVVYQNKAYAGVINLVESVDSIDREAGVIEGVTQNFIFGEKLLQLYSFDQLRQRISQVIKTELPQILEAIGR